MINIISSVMIVLFFFTSDSIAEDRISININGVAHDCSPDTDGSSRSIAGENTKLAVPFCYHGVNYNCIKNDESWMVANSAKLAAHSFAALMFSYKTNPQTMQKFFAFIEIPKKEAILFAKNINAAIKSKPFKWTSIGLCGFFSAITVNYFIDHFLESRHDESDSLREGWNSRIPKGPIFLGGAPVKHDLDKLNNDKEKEN